MKSFFVLNMLIFTAVLYGQNVISEYISPDLNTVRLHRSGWHHSNPIIRLNSDQKLQLSFDELHSGVKNYYYSITLCDFDWKESMLIPTEYFRGTLINPVSDYAYSFNTTVDYVHYNLVFPENHNRILLSGNYIIKVFENFDGENPVLIKKFMVVESGATIKAHVKPTVQSSRRESFQEIRFEVEHPSFQILNPISEVTATIIQNGRTDNIISGLRPQFFRAGFMDFNYMRETKMEGGNEFRHIDLRSRRFIVENVSEVRFIDPFYHVHITKDLSRKTEQYSFQQDFNGRYYVEVREYNNPNTEADYFFVHFSLHADYADIFEKVYINGELTNWQQNEFSQMNYNIIEKKYEHTLLLKQGYYNYHYLTVTEGNTKGTLYDFENNYVQTENDYLILIYYKGISDRSYKLIGAETFNSIN
ncbi:MAG: DUF5103 domain-containing protein [Marinilabiliaceae bacterium]|nr:DUF5103 domain-containing protein [Marinilabiliaceae bacterium]